MNDFEAIVVGSGVHGSAITYSLLKRGVRTLTLEKFSLNHTNGSSHGQTRIIRTAYAEHPLYVPLVRTAYRLWQELEDQTKKDLLRVTGALSCGLSESTLVSGIRRSAMEYGIPHEVMDAKEMKDRFKVIKPLDDEVAILEPSAGILLVEDCLRAFVTLAKGLGAQFHFNEPLIKWEANKDGVVAETENGRFSADKIIFSSGAWLPHIVTDLEIPFQCERQVFFWLRPPQNQELFAADNMPVVIWEEESGELNAVTPDLGKGIKISKHHGGDLYSSPEEVRRDVTVQDEFPLRGFLERRMPGANGSTISYTTCLYTNAPDGHFVIDYHPKHRNVIIVSPCSGHGFKFAPVVGEIVSQMVLDGNTVFDISPFSLARFKGKSEQQLLESISKIGLNVYRKH